MIVACRSNGVRPHGFHFLRPARAVSQEIYESADPLTRVYAEPRSGDQQFPTEYRRFRANAHPAQMHLRHTGGWGEYTKTVAPVASGRMRPAPVVL